MTFWNFVAMAAATIGVMYFVEIKELRRLPRDVLGAVRHHRHRQRLDLPDDPVDLPRGEAPRREGRGRSAARALALKAASIESAAALGFIGAIGACGGYLIPRGFGASIASTGGPHLALVVFLAFYVSCIALTWWYYMRRSFLARARAEPCRGAGLRR